MISTTLSEKSFIAIAVCVIICLIALTSASYLRNEPLIIYGKEFGFGSQEARKRVEELDKLRADAVETHKLLKALDKMNDQLRQENSALHARHLTRAQQDASMWFPVDDVTFFDGGRYSTQAGKVGRGKWSNADSELTLQLVTADDSAVVLATNLPAPGNKVRIAEGEDMWIPMAKFEYQLALISSDDGVRLRINRRTRQQRP